MEFRNTKKAMEKLKNKYFLLKVDRQIRGLILKSQEGLLKTKPKEYFCDPRNYSTLYCKNIGYSLKDPATKESPVKKDFKHIECNDLAVGKHAEANGKYLQAVKNQCFVLLTEEEAESNVTFKNTIKISEVLGNAASYQVTIEQDIARDLQEADVEVVDYDVYLKNLDKPAPSNDQDLNKKLSTTARPGRPSAGEQTTSKNETASFSKTQRPRKSAKSFRPKIKPANEK